MATQSKISFGVPAAPKGTSDRTLRTSQRPDYSRIQRNEVIPTNPSRPKKVVCNSADGDGYISDEETPSSIPEPPLPEMTDEERKELIQKWRIDRGTHEKKKRDKTSHVYWYMKRELLPGNFYGDEVISKEKKHEKPRLHYLQNYRWTCRECIANPIRFQNPFKQFESLCRGTSSGMLGQIGRAHV